MPNQSTYTSTNMGTGREVEESLERIQNYAPDIITWVKVNTETPIDLLSYENTPIDQVGDYSVYNYTNGPDGITATPINLCVRDDPSGARHVYLFDTSTMYQIQKDPTSGTCSWIQLDPTELNANAVHIYKGGEEPSTPNESILNLWIDDSQYTSTGAIDIKSFNTTTKTWESIFASSENMDRSIYDSTGKKTSFYSYVNDHIAEILADYGRFLHHKVNELSLIHMTDSLRTKWNTTLLSVEDLNTLLTETYEPMLESSYSTVIENDTKLIAITESTQASKVTMDTHMENHSTSAEDISEFNQIVPRDHVHDHDPNVAINGDQIVSGRFTADRLPDSAKMRYYGVDRLEDLANPDITQEQKDTIYKNGNGIYVKGKYDDPISEWYKIINNSYIGTNDYLNAIVSINTSTTQLAFHDISERPTTLSGYGLDDEIYTKTYINTLVDYTELAAGMNTVTDPKTNTKSIVIDNFDYPITYAGIQKRVREDQEMIDPHSIFDLWVQTADGTLYKFYQTREPIEEEKDETWYTTMGMNFHQDITYPNNSSAVYTGNYKSEWNLIAQGNDAYVAIKGTTPAKTATVTQYGYSTDGITWETKNLSSDGTLSLQVYNLKFEHDRFFILAKSNVYWSLDGLTWTLLDIQSLITDPSHSDPTPEYTDCIYFHWTNINSTSVRFGFTFLTYGGYIYEIINLETVTVMQLNAFSDNTRDYWKIAAVGEYSHGVYIAVNRYGRPMSCSNGASYDAYSNILTYHTNNTSSNCISLPRIAYPIIAITKEYKAGEMNLLLITSFGGVLASDKYTTAEFPHAIHSLLKTSADRCLLVPVYDASSPESNNIYEISHDGIHNRITWEAIYQLPSDVAYTSVSITETDDIILTGTNKTVTISNDQLFPKLFGIYKTNEENPKFSTDGYGASASLKETSPRAWTYSENSGLTDHIVETIHDGTKFVAKCNSTTGATSTDGITWTMITLDNVMDTSHADTAMPQTMCYTKGEYLGNAYYFINSDQTILKKTEDFKTWGHSIETAATMLFVTYIDEIGNGTLILGIKSAAGAISLSICSNDTRTWTTVPLSPNPTNAVRACYGNGKVIVITGSANYYYSTDGITWSSATFPTPTTYIASDMLCDIVFFKGNFIAISTEMNCPYVYYSSDGLIWHSALLTTRGYTNMCVSIIAGDDICIVLSADDLLTTILAISSDGEHWDEYENAGSGRGYSGLGCYGNGIFVTSMRDENETPYAYYMYEFDPACKANFGPNVINIPLIDGSTGIACTDIAVTPAKVEFVQSDLQSIGLQYPAVIKDLTEDTDTLTDQLNGIYDTLGISRGSGGTITVDITGNGTVTPPGPVTLGWSDTQEFTFAPSTDYHTKEIYKNNIPIYNLTNYTFKNLMEDTTLRVIFEIDKYTITTTDGDGFNISPSSVVDAGGSYTVTATPLMGYNYSGMTVDGLYTAGMTEYTFTNVHANHTVSASATIKQYTITTTPGDGYSITPSATLDYHSHYTVTITPDEYYNLQGITVDGVFYEDQDSFDFKYIDMDHTVSGKVAIVSYLISTTGGTGYSITGNSWVNRGGTYTVKATSTNSTYYTVTGLYIDGVLHPDITSYTFSNITENHTVSAAVTIAQFTVTTIPGTGYNITPTQTVNYNTDVTIAATSTDSMLYTIQGMYIDNQYYGGISSYTIKHVNRDFTVRAVVSTPTITWSISPMPAVGNQWWHQLCYGNGRFISVSTSDTVRQDYSTETISQAYSTDGITWYVGGLTSTRVYSICYGNGLFVAISAGSAFYSYDGITWTESPLTDKTAWLAVCYGNGKFVAVGLSTTVLYSTDGINWAVYRGAWQFHRFLHSICYGNGIFVAVAYRHATHSTDLYASYSNNGTFWRDVKLPINTPWQSVCYGNGKFVAVAGHNNAASDIAAYSTDGINWTAGTLPSSAYWRSVCYGAGKFVAVAGGDTNSNIAAYSTDGINWIAGTMPTTSSDTSVCYGGDKFVATVEDGNAAYLFG